MLDIGSSAPDFSLKDQNGNTITLSEYKGKWVILYFYPRDLTPGCTKEACNFRDTLPHFKSLNAEIIGVSKDSVKSHKKFADKHHLEFTLVSDEEGNVCEAYGTWQEKSMYGKSYMGIVRSTYVIDPKGNIAKVYPKVSVKDHHHEVEEDIKSLQN